MTKTFFPYLLIVCLCQAMIVARALSAEEHDSIATEVFRCDFESADWWKDWGLRQVPQRVSTVAEDPEFGFRSHDGKALRVRIDQGGHLGVSMEYAFEKQLGSEPEEVYFRYQLRFGSDWNPERGGKLPGIAGTYGRAGWGGRKVDGTDGWSARGLFSARQNGRTPIGFYCYHADMRGRYGAHWEWDKNGFPGLENDRWYQIEQYVKLNSPGNNDGVMRAWVDGSLAFEKTDVRMRDVRKLKIQNVWINVYYGGTQPAQQDHHMYIDNVAIRCGRTDSD